MKYKVYRLVNLVNGREYFGTTTRDVKVRIQSGYGSNTELQQDLKTYLFEFSVLKETEDKEEAQIYERKMIIEHWEPGFLYNRSIRTNIRKGSVGGIWSFEAYNPVLKRYFFSKTLEGWKEEKELVLHPATVFHHWGDESILWYRNFHSFSDKYVDRVIKSVLDSQDMFLKAMFGQRVKRLMKLENPNREQQDYINLYLYADERCHQKWMREAILSKI